MTDHKLTADDALELWRTAERRLRLVDPAPPLAMASVDALLDAMGPRRPDESLREWLDRTRTRAPVVERPSAEIIAFNPRLQRFRPVAEIVRLAADSAGTELALPSGELETTDGRFRLMVEGDEGQVEITVQALGFAADEFAGRTLGLAGEGETVPVAVLVLDEDGDGEVRLADTPALRRALLKPALGVIEDL
jgi:hypothetical protein